MSNKHIYNPYNRTDLQALKQALSMTSERYRVIRETVNKFNEKGRPDSIQKIDIIEASIIQNGDHSVDQKGQGSWSTETFTVSYIYPDYLRLENIIEHPFYGNLRVTSVNDMRDRGVSTATAVRLNSMRDIIDKGEGL